MSGITCEPVMVSRRIGASAHEIFTLLADPASHPVVDGSGMVRARLSGTAITRVGDVFVMSMHNDEMGGYEMTNHVVEYDPDRRIVWEPVMTAASRAEDLDAVGDPAGHQWGYQLTPDGPDATVVTEIFDCSRAPDWLRKVLGDGNRWVEAMTASLERLDELCRSNAGGAAPESTQV